MLILRKLVTDFKPPFRIEYTIDADYDEPGGYYEDASPKFIDCGADEGSENWELDRQENRKIHERRERYGDVWAWALVTVDARLLDADGRTLAGGTAYLGGCSYEDEEDFKRDCAYYDELKAEAVADLRAQMAYLTTLTASVNASRILETDTDA